MSVPVTYSAMLPVSEETVLFVSALLAAERRRRRTRSLDAVTEAGLPPGLLDAAESISLLQACPPFLIRVRRGAAGTVCGHSCCSRSAPCWPAPENGLNWVCDVTEGEDHSRVRTGHGPEVMAALRNTAINIIRLRGGTNIDAAHRAFSDIPVDVLDAITAA